MSEFNPVIPLDLSTVSPSESIHVPSLADPTIYAPQANNKSGTPSEAGANLLSFDSILAQSKPITKEPVVFNPYEADRYSGKYNPVADNEENYAQNQGAFKQFFGGVAKGFADLGISFAQTALFQPRAEWADEAKMKVENLLPNYYSRHQQDSNFNWLPFSGGAANFYGDKVLKGTGDMLGMIGGTAAQAAALTALTDGVAESVALPEQMVNLTMRLSKYLSGVDKTAEFLKDAGLEGDALTQSYQAAKAMQANKIVKGGIQSFANTGTNFLFSHYMAAQGEHQVYNNSKIELLKKYKDENGLDATGEALNEIDKTASNIANVGYYADLTLFMGQAMALPGLLRAFRPTSKVVKGTEAQIGNVELPKNVKVGADIDNITSKVGDKGGIYNNVIKPFGKGAFTLGAIIGVSESGHEAIKKYFEDKYDNKAKGTLDEAINDLGFGLGKTFGTEEGLGGVLTSAVIGGLIGVGEHKFTDMQRKKAGVGDVGPITRDAIEAISKYKVGDLFEAKYQGAQDAIKAEQDMGDASKDDNPWKYKNAQKDSFFNFISSGVKSNLHDVRIEQLKLIKQLPDAEIHAMFGEDKTSVLDKKQQIDRLISKAEEIKRSFDATGEIIPNPHKVGTEEWKNLEDYKELLVKTSFDKKEYTENLKELERKNKELHPMLSNDLLEDLTSKDGRDKLRRAYDEEIKYLDDQLHNKAGSTFHASELRAQAESRKAFKEMDSILKGIQDMPNIDPIVFSKGFEKVLNFELNGRRVDDSEALPMEQTVSLINRGVEVQQNKAARKGANEAYNDLFSRDGFELFNKLKDEYKEGMNLANSQKELKDNKNKSENQPFTEAVGESRLYVLDPKADPKGYEVSKESKADGTTLYSVKDLKGTVVKSFDNRKDANEEARDLNKRLVTPKSINTNGDKNGDGSIKALDESGKEINLHPEAFKNYIPVATSEEVVNGTGRKDLNWKIISTIEGRSFANPSLQTNDVPVEYEEERRGEYAAGRLKLHDENLISTTTPSKDFPGDTFAGYHVKTSQHFLSNIDKIGRDMAKDPDRGTLKIRLVWSGNEKALGVEGLVDKVVKSDITNSYDQSNPIERTVLAVYVEHKRVNGKDEYHYVNAKGERIKEGDIDNVIYQTMPTPTKNYKESNRKGDIVSRFRPKDTDEQIDRAVEQAKYLRDNLFKTTTAKDTRHYSFIVSEGHADLEAMMEKLGIDEVDISEHFRPKFSVVGRLIDKSLLDSGEKLLTIVTEKAGITTARGENIPAPLGTVWINHESTLQYLNNRTLSPKEVDTVTTLLKNYINAEEGTKKIKYDTTEDSEKVKRRAHINSLQEITSYLQGAVFFSKYKLDAPESIGDNNKIFFTDKGVLIVGKEKFFFTSDTFNKVTEVQKLKDALSLLYTNANTALLAKNEPFTESYLDDKGEVAQRKWKTYQHYLLSDTYDLHVTDENYNTKAKPTGRDTDEIPFRTSIKPRTDVITESNFDGKYSVLKDVEEVPKKVPKKVEKNEVKTSTPKAVVKPLEMGEDEGFTLPFDKPETLDEFITKSVSPTSIGTTEQIMAAMYPNEFKEYVKMDIVEKAQTMKDFLTALFEIRKAQQEAEVKDPNSISNQAKVDDIVKENTPPEKTKPKKKPKSGPSGMYRRVDPNDLYYQIHDLGKSTAWAEAKIPIPAKRMSNLIETTDGGYAFGRYIGTHIEFYENAKKGTIEHEAGEAIWASFTDNKERIKILKEFRSRGDVSFTSHEDGRVIKYKEASDHEAKEELFEEGARYILDGKLYETPKREGNLIYRLFRDIIDFVKGVRNGSIKKWFDKIDAGYYKTAPMVNEYKGTGEYAKIGKQTATNSNAITKGVTIRLMQYLLDDNKSLANFDLKGYKVDSLFQKVYSELEEEFTSDAVYDNVVDMFDLKKISEEQFKKYQELWIDIKENWQHSEGAIKEQLKRGTVKSNVLEYIKTFGVKSFEELEEIRPDNEFMKNAFEIDNNESMFSSMKLMFGTMSRKVYNEQGDVVEMIDPATRMPIPVEISIMSNYLREELSKVNTLTEKLRTLNKLTDIDPTIITLLNRLKIQDESTPLTKDDLKVIANFNNVFSKQRPDANIHEIGANFSITYPQNESSTKQRQVDAWFDAWKVLSEEDSTLIKKDPKTGNYVFNGDVIKGYDVKELEDREVGNKKIKGQISFLRDLGIEFTKEMFDRLDGKDPQRFGLAIKRLATYLPNVEIGEIDSRKTGEAGNLNVIAELYLKANGITDSSFYNIDGKQQSQDVGKNYVNSINTDINNATAKAAFLAKYSHYDQLYRTGGYYLNNVFFDEDNRTTEKTSTDYIQGKLYKNAGDIATIATMSHPERVMEEVNQNLAKNYYILVGADATTEWTNLMKHVISFQDMKAGRADKQIYNIFNDYYNTEKQISEMYTPKFKGDKYESTLVIDGLVKDYSAKNLDETALKEHLDNRTESLIKYLKESNIITESVKNGEVEGWKVKDIDTDWLKSEDMKNHFSDKDLLDLFKFTEANYMINNVEMFKLYFGDPNEAKDWLKRVKSSLSPRETSIYDNPKFNASMNTLLNEGTNPLNPRYRQHTDFISTVTLADHYTYIDHIVNDEHLPKNIRDAFKRNNDVDGAGWVVPTAHREFMYKRGQTTSDHDILYDFILANDNQLMLQDGYLHGRVGEWGYYTVEERARDKEILKHGLNRSDGTAIHATYDAIKPIVFGIGKDGKTVLHKYALAAGSYSQMRGGPMEKVYVMMLKKGIHYSVAESGVKIGAEGKYPIYNEDGSVNNVPFPEDVRNSVNFQYFGVQTEVGGSKSKQSFLTQASTDVFLNSFDGGVPTDFAKGSPTRVEDWNKLNPEERVTNSSKHSLVEHTNEVVKSIQNYAYDDLMGKLGIEDNGKNYVIPDKKPLETLLKRELLRRDTAANLKDALTLDERTGEFTTPLEAIANYKQIKDILFSYVDKTICKPKQNGEALVLQPGLSKGNVGNVETKKISSKKGEVVSFVTDHKDDKAIQFYKATYENGKRTKVFPAEIVMTSRIPDKMRLHPRWKDATDEELMSYLKKKDESILHVVGARIPTQEMNSIEAMNMKAFLPSYHGSTALVSEGMTTKAGLDFDADKMNTYQMNVYMDKAGDVHRVPFFGIEKGNAMPHFIEIAKSVYDHKRIEVDVDDEDIEDLSESKAEELFKQSLQNEYYASMHKIILDPDNYERLIKPNSADESKAISSNLEKLAPTEFSANSKGSLLDRMYMSQQRHYFILGKAEVSKLAMGQKMHSMYQLSQVYVDSKRFGNLADQDKKFLGDGKLLLPHNKTVVNEIEYSTISGIKDINNKDFISDTFSQGIDGTVDIAKGAWLMNIIQHPMMTSKLATLIHFGVDKEIASQYLNQPILREFVKMLSAQGSTYMFKDVNSQEREALLKLFPIGGEDVAKAIVDRTKQELDPSILPDRIEEYYNPSRKDPMTFEKNIEQHMILQDFFKICVYDKALLNLQTASTWDTKSSGDPSLYYRKRIALEEARTKNPFSSIDNVLESTHLSNLSYLVGFSSESIAEGVFKIGERDVRKYMEKILDKFPKSLSLDRYKRIANSMEESFISYALQTDDNNPINLRIKELLVDTKTNMAKRILDFRNSLLQSFEDSDIANNMFLKELVVQTKNKSFDVKNVFPSRKPKMSQAADTMTDAMREFRDNPHVQMSGIWDDLLTTALLQSGISSSRISFSRYIPNEDYGALLTHVVNRIGDVESLSKWVQSDDFFRGQWNNQYLAPRVFEEYTINKNTLEPGYSKHRLSADEVKAFNLLKQSKPEYTPISIKIPRHHEWLNKYTIEDGKLLFKGHPNLDLKIVNGQVKGPLGDTYGRSRGNAVEEAREKINEMSIEAKNKLNLTKLASPVEDDGLLARHGDYRLFRFRPDSKEGQSLFINFTAQNRANLIAMSKDPSTREQTQSYLLKRVDRVNQDGTTTPERINGYYIYAPISTRGDGWHAEEHYTDGRQSVLKGNGYQVPLEIPMDEIRRTLIAVENARAEKVELAKTQGVVKTDLVKPEEKTTFGETTEHITQEEVDSIVDKLEKSNSLFSSRESALVDANKFLDRAKKDFPNKSKKDLLDDLDCYLSAPF